MANTYWVCKADGTIQCQNDPEISLDAMHLQLASVIGEREILNQEKRSHQVVQLCGMPSGSVNAYEIAENGYWILTHGIVGPIGFALCDAHHAAITSAAPVGTGRSAPPPNFATLLAQSRATSVIAIPTQIRELIGRPLRVYATGDQLTQDFRSERVNIEIDAANRRHIVDIWFG